MIRIIRLLKRTDLRLLSSLKYRMCKQKEDKDPNLASPQHIVEQKE